MQIFQNDQGHTVYRLEKITDLALLPDDQVEPALKNLELLVHMLRVAIACDESGEILEAIPDFVDWTADGKDEVTIKDAGGTGLKAEIKPYPEVDEG